MSVNEQIRVITQHLADAQEDMARLRENLDAAVAEMNDLAHTFGVPSKVASVRGTRRRRDTMSLPKLIQAVLKPAGRPMTVTEILQENELRGLGYNSRAANPADSVDIQMYKLAKRPDIPIKKVAPRTWEWQDSPRSSVA